MYDIIIVRGGFDPVHVGHLRMIQAASSLAHHVVVGVNSDDLLNRKKGYVFMPFDERCEILQGFTGVSTVMGFDDSDNTASGLIQKVSVSFTKLAGTNLSVAFANGGDRTSKNVPEQKVCNDLGVEMVWGVGGGKIQSSSDLVAASKKAKSS